MMTTFSIRAENINVKRRWGKPAKRCPQPEFAVGGLSLSLLSLVPPGLHTPPFAVKVCRGFFAPSFPQSFIFQPLALYNSAFPAEGRVQAHCPAGAAGVLVVQPPPSALINCTLEVNCSICNVNAVR